MRQGGKLRQKVKTVDSHIAWLGEEKLAWMEGTMRRLLRVPGRSEAPAAIVAGAVTELREGDTICLAGAKPLKKALKHVDWQEDGGKPGMVATWKAAREASGDQGGGRVVLAFCGEIERRGSAELAAGCRKSMERARTERLPMIFIMESVGEGSEVGFGDGRWLPALPGGAYFPEILVDGEDVLAIFRVAQEAIAHARRGQGPVCIVCWRRRDRS